MERPEETYKTDLALLHELALVHKLYVQFDEMGEEGPGHRPTFHMEVRVGDFVGHGSGPTKQQAKLNAASKVIEELKKLPVPEDTTPYWCKPHLDLMDPLERPYFFFKKSPVSALLEILMVRKEKTAEFQVVDYRTLPRNRIQFTVEVRVGKMSCQAMGPSKQKAKVLAAEKMLEMMGFRELMELHNPPMQPHEAQLFQQHVFQLRAQHKMEHQEALRALRLSAQKPGSNQEPEPRSPQELKPVSDQIEGCISVQLDEMQLQEIQLEEIQLEAIQLPEIQFEEISLKKISEFQLEEFQLEKIQLEEMQLPEIQLEEFQMEKFQLEELLLEEIQLPEIQLEKIQLEEIQVEEIPVEERQFLEVQLEEVQLEKIQMEKFQLPEIPLEEFKPVEIEPEITNNTVLIQEVIITSPVETPSEPEEVESTVRAHCSEATHCMIVAMMKKLVRKLKQFPDRDQQVALVQKLKRVENQVVIPENSELRAKDLKVIGKAAAKSLLQEIGSASSLFLDSNTDFFEATVKKHLTVQVNSFSPNSKTWRSRFFSGLSKIMRSNLIPKGPLATYLLSGPVH